MTWIRAPWQALNAEFGLLSATAPGLNVHPAHAWTLDAPADAGRFRTCVHRGDARLPGLVFDTCGFTAPDADLLVVDGDLSIEGDLVVEQLDVGTPGYLVVAGDLRARNLFLTGQFELVVRGDACVDGVIHGHDGSTGRLVCGGRLVAGAVLLDGYAVDAGSIASPIACTADADGAPCAEVRVAGAAATDVVMVTADDELWWLRLPADLDLDRITATDQLLPYTLLTREALAEYTGADPAMRIGDILRRRGVDALRAGWWPASSPGTADAPR